MPATSLPFVKMHGLGNDFVILDASKHKVNAHQINIPLLAHRHLGIGFDQLLILHPGKNADFSCQIFNADGGIAESCGNGLRCLARYIHEQGLRNKTTFTIETIAGVFSIVVKDYNHITVDMGVPVISNLESKIGIGTKELVASLLSVGNPHAIIRVSQLGQTAVGDLGARITSTGLFKNGVNVGFMEIVTSDYFKLRTYERGVGETYSCGTNACAAAVAGIMQGWLRSPLTVEVRYGKLIVAWDAPNETIKLSGPASLVYHGSIQLEAVLA